MVKNQCVINVMLFVNEYENPRSVSSHTDAAGRCLLGEPEITELLSGVHSSGLGPTIVTVLPSSPLL
jgi:hypothetical protein